MTRHLAGSRPSDILGFFCFGGSILSGGVAMASAMTRLGRRGIGSARWSSMAVAGQQSRASHSFTLPDLDYDYGELEPAISGEIMKLHHTKHHQTYITNFVKALEQLEQAEKDGNAEAIVKLQGAINFNGGGHVNHSIFWKNLAPSKSGGGEPPEGKLASAIKDEFGSLEKLIAKMNADGAALQGSGWVWLGLNKDLKQLAVQTTANQDPLASKGLVPLLGIDVWEHAYYLQYKNVKPDYLKNIWKVINWSDVSSRYEANL
ncbi:superoxide dismutase [Mn], mitochondrial isoform X2 [Selaginella moellendorffii]|uniref:superoxide dismutase [Mn], mitochondrial isoform X2 n=1 Tax=Selaginella moellendorffii TaxID=88036 RepID=UPI000D1CA16E|nr:superoxide dismutase [Mn], mitochondrial isoform X2 [Selaginella moellendorffii]|eukprot:XP_024530400.1 superoxide dismutase [Mn], mitochondrial isoform X2 [Selaginella moellendorffii]